jgi:hypothetical protein
MRRSGGNLSHAKHRSCGVWGQVTRKHRSEVARLLGGDRAKRSQAMFGSIRDLMDRRAR